MTPAIEQQAADWIARQNGQLTPAEKAELARWLAADPRHAAAFAALHQTWSRLHEPRLAGQADAVWAGLAARHQQRATQRRRAVFAGIGIAAALAVMVWRTAEKTPPLPASPDAPSVAATAPTFQILPDGSRLTARTGAAVAVDFTPTLRRVRLVRGEAIFSVTKDARRPFVVQTGPVEVRAVGTEFSVRTDAGAVTVLVTEGRIAVTAPPSAEGAAAAPVFASAGDRVVVPAATAGRAPTVSSVTPANVTRELAWRGARLEFSNTPLDEALAKFNRRATRPLVLADPTLSRRTISGVIWENDSESLVRLLENGLDLRAEPDGNVVRLHSRQ